MDAVEFFKERNRMCNHFRDDCKGCPAIQEMCSTISVLDERIVSIVEKWARENPHKTRQSEFLKHYPEATMYDGVVNICPMAIYGDDAINCSDYCLECIHQFWLTEIE